jgi:multiple sugar transport system permease protein
MENLLTTVKLMKYPSALSLSLQLNIVSSLLQLAVCALTGYGFARFEFKFKNVFFALAVFTIFIPSQLVAIPLFMQFKDFNFFGVGSLIGLFTGVPLTVNLIDSPLTYYLPAILGAGIKSGLFIFIYRQFFKGLPRELEDAAAIDGCGFFSCFLKIMVPNAMVAFVTVFLLSTVWYWNDYYTASMFMRNVNTISTSLANLTTSIAAYSGDISIDPYKTVIYLQAGCLLFILPVLVMYIFLQRFFIQGVERSGIVG